MHLPVSAHEDLQSESSETAPCPSTLHEAQEEGQEKPLLCGAFREPSNGLEPLTPSLPSRVPGKRMQLQAASCKESAGLSKRRCLLSFARVCVRSAPQMLHTDRPAL